MSRTIRHRAHRADPTTARHADPREAAAATEFTRRLRESLARTLLNAGDATDADASPLTVPRAWAPLGPAQLASAHPGSAVDRLTVRALYERCLLHYRTAVRADDSARGLDDVGAALARFVAANVEALHGTHATRSMLRRLEGQLVGIVRRSPAWSIADVQDRQAFFEQVALLSVLVADCTAQAHLQGQASIENLQRAASGYLRQLIGLDPEWLTLGPEGLALRSDPVLESAPRDAAEAVAWAERVAEPA
jgi:hypothetical protein